jgi:hypothetical protein
VPYLSTSLARDAVVFLRLGAGMRHSIEKAVQLVHGMPNEAASQRTCLAVMGGLDNAGDDAMITYLSCMTRCEWWLASVFRATEVPRLVNNVDITPRSAFPPREGRAGLERTYFRMLCSRAGA